MTTIKQIDPELLNWLVDGLQPVDQEVQLKDGAPDAIKIKYEAWLKERKEKKEKWGYI